LNRQNQERLLAALYAAIERHGWRRSWEKTWTHGMVGGGLSYSRQAEITGFIVRDGRLTISGPRLKKYRVLLHNFAQTDQPEERELSQAEGVLSYFTRCYEGSLPSSVSKPAKEARKVLDAHPGYASIYLREFISGVACA
jgi:hypothetical protein